MKEHNLPAGTTRNKRQLPSGHHWSQYGCRINNVKPPTQSLWQLPYNPIVGQIPMFAYSFHYLIILLLFSCLNPHLFGGLNPLKNMKVTWDEYSQRVNKNRKCSKMFQTNNIQQPATFIGDTMLQPQAARVPGT